MRAYWENDKSARSFISSQTPAILYSLLDDPGVYWPLKIARPSWHLERWPEDNGCDRVQRDAKLSSTEWWHGDSIARNSLKLKCYLTDINHISLNVSILYARLAIGAFEFGSCAANAKFSFGSRWAGSWECDIYSRQISWTDSTQKHIRDMEMRQIFWNL